MKLLYITTHQIPNLVSLFRELSKKDEISFKAVYWQNIPADYYDKDFNKVYIEELKYFINCSENNTQAQPNLDVGIDTMKLILAAEKSQDIGKKVII